MSRFPCGHGSSTVLYVIRKFTKERRSPGYRDANRTGVSFPDGNAGSRCTFPQQLWSLACVAAFT